MMTSFAKLFPIVKEIILSKCVHLLFHEVLCSSGNLNRKYHNIAPSPLHVDFKSEKLVVPELLCQ